MSICMVQQVTLTVLAREPLAAKLSTTVRLVAGGGQKRKQRAILKPESCFLTWPAVGTSLLVRSHHAEYGLFYRQV
jgi:hypothetical protein